MSCSWFDEMLLFTDCGIYVNVACVALILMFLIWLLLFVGVYCCLFVTLFELLWCFLSFDVLLLVNIGLNCVGLFVWSYLLTLFFVFLLTWLPWCFVGLSIFVALGGVTFAKWVCLCFGYCYGVRFGVFALLDCFDSDLLWIVYFVGLCV